MWKCTLVWDCSLVCNYVSNSCVKLLSCIRLFSCKKLLFCVGLFSVVRVLWYPLVFKLNCAIIWCYSLQFIKWLIYLIRLVQNVIIILPVCQFNGLDWSLLVKHLEFEEVHNSWLYTANDAKAKHVSQAQEDSWNNITKSCVYIQITSLC